MYSDIKDPGARFLSKRKFKRRFHGEKIYKIFINRSLSTAAGLIIIGRQDCLDKRMVVSIC